MITIICLNYVLTDVLINIFVPVFLFIVIMSGTKTKIKVVLHPRIYSDGKRPIMIRITRSRKSNYISVGHNIPANAWNEDEGLVWERKPTISPTQKASLTPEEYTVLRRKYSSIEVLSNAAKINSDIKKVIGDVEKQKQKLEANDERITAEIIKRKVDRKDSESAYSVNFMEFIKKVAADKFQARQIRTSEKYMVLHKKLDDFLKNKALPIDRLTPSFLKDFELFLKTEGCHPNYIHTNIKAFKTIVRKEAIRTERIITPDKDPFFDFPMISVIPTKKERLSMNEVLALEKLKLQKDDKLCDYRNAWLFSYYLAGIRVGDLMQLRWQNITKDGRLDYTMGKTDKLRSISLLPQALAIIRQYNDLAKNETDYIFPFLDNSAEYAVLITHEDRIKADPKLLSFLYKRIESNISQYNLGLKKIAVKAQIKKNLTTHTARHSFADAARQKGISTFDISKTLGHSSIKITESYLDSIALDVIDATVARTLK